MKFQLSEITRVQKGNRWIEIQRAFANRSQAEVKEQYHDMAVSETRTVANGIEITRIE